MFGRKLRKRIDRLEKLLDGQKETTSVDGFLGFVFHQRAEIGLRDRLSALEQYLDVSYGYDKGKPAQLPRWKVRKKSAKPTTAGKSRKRPNG